MINISFSWNPSFLKSLSVAEEEAHEALDEVILDYCEPYIPRKTGATIESGRTTGDGVEWSTPYVAQIYYGVRPDGSPIIFNGAPMRGAYWFDRMLNDKADELEIVAVSTYVEAIR